MAAVLDGEACARMATRAFTRSLRNVLKKAQFDLSFRHPVAGLDQGEAEAYG